MSGAAEVTCSACGKRLQKSAAIGVNGKWSHASPTCFGRLLREQPSVSDLGRQLGLFAGGRRGAQ